MKLIVIVVVVMVVVGGVKCVYVMFDGVMMVKVVLKEVVL